MLSILGLITGLAGPLAQATASISDLLKAKTEAKSNIQLADINRQLEEVHDKKAVLVAQAGNRLSSTLAAIAAFGLAIGPIGYTIHYYLYTKVFGSLYGCAKEAMVRTKDECATFNVDPLDPTMASVLVASVGF